MAGGQPAQEPPPGEVDRRRRVERVLEHPELQGSMRRSLSGRRAAGRHQPDRLWLRRARRQGRVRPLAYLPGLWDQPAPRPQRRPEPREGRAGPSGSRGVGCGGEPSIPRLEPGECQTRMFMPVFARIPRALLALIALIALCFTLGFSACGGSATTSVTTLTSAGGQQGGGQASQVAVTGAVTGTIASVGACHVETGNQFRAVWTETIGGALYLFPIVAPQFNP